MATKDLKVVLGIDMSKYTKGLAAAASDAKAFGSKMSTSLSGAQNTIKTSFKQLDVQMKTVKAQFGAISASMTGTGGKSDLLKVKAEQLTKQIEIQQQIVAKANQEFLASAEAKGLDSMATQKLQLRLAKAQESEALLQRELRSANTQLNTQATELEHVGHNMANMGPQINGFLGKLADVHTQMNLMFGGMALSSAFTYPFVRLTKSALDASIGFEEAFAGVRKTVDATEEEFAQLETTFRNMSKQMPITASELALIGELGGQLGISGAGNIAKFTDVIAKLSVSTNMTADQAATSLAQFANVMQMPIGNMGRLGSVVVDLGNKLAATESQIVDMAQRMVGAGRQIGLTESQVMSFAGALASAGVEVEAGGSAMSRVFVELANAAASGGDSLNLFAAVSGMSAGQFKTAFQQDAASATTSFIQGLQRVREQGGNVFAVLDKLGLGEVRVRMALLNTASAGDMLARSLQIGNDAWEENTALNKEAAGRFKTTGSQIKIALNYLRDLALTFGDTLAPMVTKAARVVEVLVVIFEKIPKPIQWIIFALGGLLATIGPVMLMFSMLGSATLGLATANMVLHKTLATLIIPAFNILRGAVLLIINPAKLFAAAMAVLNFVLVTNPIIGVIILLTALALSFKSVRDWAGRAFDRVKQFFSLQTAMASDLFDVNAALEEVKKQMDGFTESTDAANDSTKKFLASFDEVYQVGEEGSIFAVPAAVAAAQPPSGGTGFGGGSSGGAGASDNSERTSKISIQPLVEFKPPIYQPDPLPVWQSALSGLSNQWTTFSEKMSQAGEAFREWWTGNWGRIGQALQPAVSALTTQVAVTNAVYEAVKLLTTGFQVSWNLAWSGIKAAVQPAILVATSFSSAWTTATSAVQQIFKSFNNTWKATWDGLKSAVQPIINVATGFSTAWNTAITAVKNTFEGFRTGLSNTWGKIKDTITKPFQDALNWISSHKVLLGVLGVIAGGLLIASGAGIPAALAGGLAALSGGAAAALPAFAEGGIATSPTLGVFGEKKPEAIIPLDRLNEFGGGGTSIDYDRLALAIVGALQSSPLTARIDTSRTHMVQVNRALEPAKQSETARRGSS